MIIRRKGLLTIGILIPAMVAIIYFVVQDIINREFGSMEAFFVKQNVERVRELFDHEVKIVSDKVPDWAYWDDCYKFVQDINSAFIDTNLRDEALTDLGVDFMVFFNKNGASVYSKYLGPKTHSEMPFPSGLEEIIRQRHVSGVRYREPTTDISGVISSRQGLLITASRSILTSKREGPSEGTLVFGTFFSEQDVTRLSKIIDLPIGIISVTSSQSIPEVRRALLELLAGARVSILPISAKHIRAYGLIRGMDHRPAYLFSVDMGRRIYEQGMTALRYFLIVLVIVAFVFSVFILMPLEAEIVKSEKSDERFRQVTNHVGECVWEVDADGLYTYVSPIFKKILGYNPEEVVGKKYFFDFFDPSIAEPLKEEVFAIIKKKGVFSDFVNICVHRDGRRVILETNAAPIFNARGVLAGYRGADRDVTERKRMEEDLRSARDAANVASKEKSNFLANMSHEIRTPMNAILGFADLLVLTSLTVQQRDYINTIMASGKVLLTVINDILDVSKIEAGQVLLEKIDFNMAHIIEEMSMLFTPRLSGKPVKFTYDIGMDVPLNLQGDPTRVKQILMNLIGNAVKFTQEGEIRLAVRMDEQINNETVRLLISVKDTGIGISPDKQSAIFDAFVQADMSMTRKYGGTGLGLAICQKLIALMGGKIWVSSKLGQGSEFFFTIVFTRKPRPAIHNIPLLLIGALQGKRLLIVERDVSVRALVLSQCRDVGIEPSVLSSIGEAIDLLEHMRNAGNIPDIVMTDFALCEGDSCRLIKYIRTTPGIAHIKCIATSSTPMPGMAQEVNREGFDAFLPKPFTADEFVRVVRTLMANGIGEGAIVTRHMASELSCAGKRVLVVEDVQTNQFFMREVLRSFGCEVDIASDGATGVDMAQKKKYDVIFMDIQMPGMNGFEATALIRQKIGADVPIIALTASVLRNDAKKAIAAGMDDFLGKPIDIIKLKDAIIKWCG